MLVYDVHIFYYFSIHWSDTSLSFLSVEQYNTIFKIKRGHFHARIKKVLSEGV